MKKAAIFAIAISIVAATVAGCGLLGRGAGHSQIFCPVTGEPALKDYSIEHNGARIYFSGAECVEMFKADPKRHLSTNDAILNGANPRCPVSGKVINPEIYTEYRGRRAYFADEKARIEYRSNPEKFNKALDEMQEQYRRAEPISD